MITFLPFEGFELCARALDKKRCWKQVVEAKQILCILHYELAPSDWKESKAWINRNYINHPAIKMWIGYEEYLAVYYQLMLNASKNIHGINTDLPDHIIFDPVKQPYPWWLGNEDFHRSHRARLIEKDSDFYLPKFPNDKGFNEGKYLWPDIKKFTFYII